MINEPHRAFKICKNDDGKVIGQIEIEITKEEQQNFGIKILNEKIIKYFSKIFGEKNVELLEE